MKKCELLAPAGTFLKLKYALHYGADAVYFGIPYFSLRGGEKGFSYDDLKKGVEYVHEKEKKAYITINIYPHNNDIEKLKEHLIYINTIKPDGLILSDPGVLELVKEISPNIDIILSTQANVINWKSAKFWYDHGVKRIILARELSLNEIKFIRSKVPEIELEVFIHGSMCISYSGRCLLSSFLTGKSANMGECKQPCRWKYFLMEETRQGEFFPVFEDDHGSYILNSKDLCLIQYLPELINAGINSFKIEGRFKSIYYLSIVTKVYRKALDECFKNPDKFNYKPYLEELLTTSNRGFTTGFINGKRGDQDYIHGKPQQSYNFVGLVRNYDPENKVALVEVRNRISKGDNIEFITNNENFKQQLLELNTLEENNLQSVHVGDFINIHTEYKIDDFTLIRKIGNKILE